MLLLNSHILETVTSYFPISIHHMLLLNKAEQQAIGQYFDFNTSHVTIKPFAVLLDDILHKYYRHI